MRRIALLAALCLLAGACGDDAATTTDLPATTAASTTTTLLPTTAAATTTGPGTSSTTAEGTTTSTTYGFATFDVPAVGLCVVDHAAGETLNVRSGPGTSYGVVGTLPFDQTAVQATGTAANSLSLSAICRRRAKWLAMLSDARLCGLTTRNTFSGPPPARATIGQPAPAFEVKDATGKTVRFPLCAIFTFGADDKIGAEIVYYDRLTVLTQLGVA